MHTAQMLKVKVKLCPYARYDNLKDDVCIKNLNKRVDSENAFCSWEPDRKSIHDAILSESPNGFKDIDTNVEKVRLQYLLEYPVDLIIERNESKREAFQRYLVSSIETMVCRVYTITVSELPHFRYFHNKQSEEESPDTVAAFREWKESVENLFQEKKNKTE